MPHNLPKSSIRPRCLPASFTQLGWPSRITWTKIFVKKKRKKENFACRRVVTKVFKHF